MNSDIDDLEDMNIWYDAIDQIEVDPDIPNLIPIYDDGSEFSGEEDGELPHYISSISTSPSLSSSSSENDFAFLLGP